MIPGIWNFTIYKGATFRYVITATDAFGAPITWGALYTGAKLQIRRSANSSEVLYEMSLNDGIVFTGTQMILTISAADTEALTFTSGVYALELNDSSDPVVVDRWFDGEVEVSAEVVRS